MVGRDDAGFTYYETPADPARGIRRPRRSFTGRNEDSWSDPMPAEWEAWLRYRRDDPPTPEEIYANMELAANRKRLGDESNRKLSTTKEPPRSTTVFDRYPHRKDYEPTPDGDFSKILKGKPDEDESKKPV